VLGPAWYGYATADSLAPLDSPAVRPLTTADLPLLARPHEQVRAEREESGTTGLPAFGYIDDGALLAIACLSMWKDMPTIGVLTHPQARRQCLAGQVVTAAAREGLNRRPVVQYRAGGPIPPRSPLPHEPGSPLLRRTRHRPQHVSSISGMHESEMVPMGRVAVHLVTGIRAFAARSGRWSGCGYSGRTKRRSMSAHAASQGVLTTTRSLLTWAGTAGQSVKSP